MSKKSSLRTIDQLRSEIARLEALAKEQETTIKADYGQLKEQLRPENLVIDTLSRISGIRIRKGEFLKNGMLAGIRMLIERFFFKTENTFERKVYSWIDRLFDNIKYYTNKYSKFGSVRSENIEEDR